MKFNSEISHLIERTCKIGIMGVQGSHRYRGTLIFSDRKFHILRQRIESVLEQRDLVVGVVKDDTGVYITGNVTNISLGSL